MAHGRAHRLKPPATHLTDLHDVQYAWCKRLPVMQWCVKYDGTAPGARPPKPHQCLDLFAASVPKACQDGSLRLQATSCSGHMAQGCCQLQKLVRC